MVTNYYKKYSRELGVTKSIEVYIHIIVLKRCLKASLMIISTKKRPMSDANTPTEAVYRTKADRSAPHHPVVPRLVLKHKISFNTFII